jgi:hypothetical protein
MLSSKGRAFTFFPPNSTGGKTFAFIINLSFGSFINLGSAA